MNPIEIISQTGLHVLYIFGFWGVWKLLDAFLFLVVFKKKNCSYCKVNESVVEAKEEQVKVLKKQLDNQLKDVENLHEKLHNLEFELSVSLKSSPDYLNDLVKMLSRNLIEQRVVQKINTCNVEELDLIHGVGTVTAKRLVLARPFYDFSQVENILSKRVSNDDLFSWADPNWDHQNEIVHLPIPESLEGEEAQSLGLTCLSTNGQ